MMLSSPIAVLGRSVISPINQDGDLSTFWRRLSDKNSALAVVDRFDTSGSGMAVAGVVDQLDSSRNLLPKRLYPQTDHMTRMALISTCQALEDSRLDLPALDGDRVGVVSGSTSGGFDFGEQQLYNQWSKGAKYVSAFQSFAWFYAVNAGQASILHNFRGPSGVVVSGDSGGADAILTASRRLRQGAQVMLVIGADSSICPWGWAALASSRRYSSSPDPETAYRPYSKLASGPVPGEGAASLVLAPAESKDIEGQRKFGYLVGSASSFDRCEDGPTDGSLTDAIRRAIKAAGMTIDDIDVVFADAEGSAAADASEAASIREVFGPFGVPVTAPKTLTGRIGSADTPIALVAALLSFEFQVIPPIEVDVAGRASHGIDLVQTARDAKLKSALLISRGSKRNNRILVLTHQLPTS